MEARDIELIAEVQGCPGIAPAALAAHLGISARTVRSRIRACNDLLAGVARIDFKRDAPHGPGYVLTIAAPGEFAHLMRVQRAAVRVGLPATRSDRVAYLLNDLLQRTDWITLDEFAEMLYVSRASISGDLKQVEATLARFGLALEKRPRYGIRVSGPEMTRRICLAGIVVDRFEGGGLVGSGADDRASSDLMLDVVSQSVDRGLSEAGFHINSMVYQNLLVHIAIALLRIRKGCYVPMEAESLAKMCGTREFEVAHRIAVDIERRAGIVLPDEEVAYMAIHLAGKQTLAAGSSDEDGLVISDEVWGVVSRMLDRVWEAFRFDFRADLELRMNLARHIVPLSVRLRFHLSMENPILADIRARFPLAFSMARDASVVLAEAYGSELSEDETGYIALAFALALERKKGPAPKKRVLIVCASGRGSARLLEYRYRQEFGDYLESVETCDVSQVASRDFSQIDYVFTTVPLREAPPVPVREVSFFLEPEDVITVRDLLKRGMPATDGARYFSRELFFAHVACETKEQVITLLCERAAALREVSPNFEELVWERERAGATAFGGGVALPHPMQAAAAETFVTVALLDEPISWDGQEVQAVFLVAIAPDGHDELGDFYEGLAAFFIDTASVRDLLEHQDFERLLALLQVKIGR